MKKLFYFLFIALLSTSQISFAANAALVASIHEDPMSRVITTADIIEAGYLGTQQAEQNNYSSTTKTFYIDGILERQNMLAMADTHRMMPEDIYSQTDLENFARGIIQDNIDTISLTVETNTISLTRVIPAKLFGVIDYSAQEIVTVTNWGDGTNNIEVALSWWGMFSKNQTSDKVLSDNVYKRIKNISPAPFSSYLSASTIARIINEIQDAFNENTGSSTSNQ